MTPKDNFIDICNLTTNVLGLRKGSLAYKSRKHPLHLARLVAGVIGRMDKIHHKVIGDVLKRDRSLIYHYEKQHSNNYATYELYRDFFNKVYKTHHNLKKSKKVFIDRYRMKEYLLKHGVTESENPQVEIYINSGDVGVTIKTTYFQCSNQVENIKFVLQDYNYEIDWK